MIFLQLFQCFSKCSHSDEAMVTEWFPHALNLTRLPCFFLIISLLYLCENCLNYSIQAETVDANLALEQRGWDLLLPVGQSVGWYIWMWQKVPSIDIFWHVTLVKIMPSPCDIKWQPPPHIPSMQALPAPPLSTLSSKRQADILKVCYFASAGTDCSGSFVLEAPAECISSYLHWSRHKGEHIKLVV